MAYYPKYNKKKKSKKAFVGAATAAIGLGKAIYGGVQAKRAKDAEKAFNKDRLKMGVSKATQQMVDEPIDQDYIERMQQQQGASQASAMDALKRDPRNTLAGVQALSQQAGNQRTAMLGLQQDAKTKALTNLAQEQRSVEQQRLAVAGQELEGIRGEKAAGVQNIFGGIEDIASGVNVLGGSGSTGSTSSVGMMPKPTLNTSSSITSGGLKRFEKGGEIESEEGGVTPGKFDHNSNPIDMVQDGEKIGEATGGELILPPDDVEAVRAALEGGDKDAAFKLMQDLVDKYDDNVIEADGEKDKAQEGATVTEPTTPPVNADRAKEIRKIMMSNSKQVRNLGELPFDEDPTNPAGLLNFINSQLSSKIDSSNVAEINFVKDYREFMVKEQGRTDGERPKMMAGGYLAKVKARMGSYMKSKY
ncbi:MAG: hypothetical protein CMJ25_29155 [Phycisphaerae bacterium]|nr:hypothetical protein [Phycisphaerae bacterium]